MIYGSFKSFAAWRENINKYFRFPAFMKTHRWLRSGTNRNTSCTSALISWPERREKPTYSDAPFITKVTWQNYKLIAPWTSFFLDVLTARCKDVEHSQRPGAPSPARARLWGLRAGSASREPRAAPSQQGPGRGSPPARREGQGQGWPQGWGYTCPTPCPRNAELWEWAMKCVCTHWCQ